ncbi:MAG: CAP domain-containing protein [Tistlia sp.]|uniref:CAP domain-containing protein n=1 Tax=Tistlia sp. TaxID=3057121 RepID=UPI0034A35A80
MSRARAAPDRRPELLRLLLRTQKLSLALVLWAIVATPSLADNLVGGGSQAPGAEARLAREERTLLDLINGYRQSHGLAALAWNDRLAEAAAAHNDAMARGGYFAHCSPGGACLPARLGAAGYRFRSAAENLAAGQRSPRTVLRAWQGSPGHDENLLAPAMTEAGIDADPREIRGARRLWTLVLARPAD